MSLFSNIGGFLGRTATSLGAGGIVSDAISTIGGLFSKKPDYKGIAEYQNELNKQAIDRQHQANMSLAQYQYRVNQEAIREQNEYNSPKEQMKRLKDAGLNPHLVYGSGASGAAGTQTQTAKFEAPQVPLQEMVSHKGLELQNYQLVQDMEMRNEQIRNMTLKNDYQETKNDIQSETKEHTVQRAILVNELTEGKITLDKALKKLREQQTDFLTEQEATEYVKRGLLSEQTMKTRDYRDKILPQQSALLAASISKQNELLNLVKQQVDGKKLLNEYERNTLESRIKLAYEQLEQAGFATTIMQHKSMNWERFGQEFSLYSQMLGDAAKSLGQEGFKFVFDLLEAYATGGTSAVRKIIEYDSKGRVTGGKRIIDSKEK